MSDTANLITETLVMTALLIAAVLLLRRPVAAIFGPRMAYALWMIPALRLVLPPLPGGETMVAAAPVFAVPAAPLLVDVPVTATSLGWFELLLSAALPLWIGGAVIVLVVALLRHFRWVRALRQHGTPLDRVGGVRVVMADNVDGPVAIGLWRPLIVVPADFFARYNRAERDMAIAHELAHHRAGDLWANAAALTVLAAQWFNPFAWRAVHAFRFDQEAACDARVLAGLEPDRADHLAHSYACAIAKSVAGPRLLLAAPITSGTKVKERLQMLTQNPRLGLRPAMGRLLLGAATLGALALTASTLPARVVYAAEPVAAPAPPAQPAPPAAPGAEKNQERQVMIFHSTVDDDAAAGDAKDAADKKVSVHQIMINADGDSSDKPRVMMFGGDHGPNVDVRMVPSGRISMPLVGANSDELRATLKEQGIDDAKADAIIKRLDEKRHEAAAKMREATNFARLSIVPLIPSTRGFPMTEGTYLKLRQMSVPSLSEQELLERTLTSMMAARENYARKVGDPQTHDQRVMDALDREIEHLRVKIKRQ